MKPPSASSTNSEESPKRGRPPGEVTPEGLIRQELVAHLRLYRKTRELVESRLDDRGISAEDLAKYMDLLRRGIGDLAKSVVPVARPAEAKTDDSGEDGETILARLIEGSAR